MISNEGHEPFRKNHPISISWERKFNFESTSEELRHIFIK